MNDGWYDEIRYGSGDMPWSTDRVSWLQANHLRLTVRGRSVLAVLSLASILLVGFLFAWLVIGLGTAWTQVN